MSNFIITTYCDFIIKPIEELRNEMMYKYYSKNIFHMLNRSFYKEKWDEYEEILYEKRMRLTEIVNEEIAFQKELIRLMKEQDAKAN